MKIENFQSQVCVCAASTNLICAKGRAEMGENMKGKKKRLMAKGYMIFLFAFTLALTVAMGCCGIGAVAGGAYEEMEVHFQVYDASTKIIHSLGTKRIATEWDEEKDGRYGMLVIPELSEVIPSEAKYGVLQKVTGSWCGPIGDGSPGGAVRFLADKKNAEVLYWVNYYDPDGTESNVGGSSPAMEISVKNGSETKWDSDILYHCNWPNGRDVTCRVTYHISTYKTGRDIKVLGELLEFEKCGFEVQRGYRKQSLYWSALPDGPGTKYSGKVYFHARSDAGKTTHIYAVYSPIPLSEDDFYQITYKESDETKDFGVSCALKGNPVTAGIVYKENYKLNGWSMAPNDNHVVYKAGEAFVPDENMTLYAVWNWADEEPEESESEPEEGESEPEESESEPEESESEPEESESEPEESESEPEESESEPEESESEPEESESEPEESESEPEESESEPEESESEPEESESEPEESESEPEESESEPEESESEPEESESEPEESESEPEESESEPGESESEPEENESEPEESQPESEESESEPEESESEPEESQLEPEESQPEPEESESEPEESESEPEESEPEPEESQPEPEESESEPEESQPEPEPEESEPEPEESQPELKESRVTEPQESGQEQVKPEGEEIRTADSPITGEDNSILYFLYIIFLLCAIVCHTKHLSEIQS